VQARENLIESAGKKFPMPTYRPPKPPANLTREAKAWWRRIVERWELDEHCLLLLGNALEALGPMREAQKILSEEGRMVEDRFGQKKEHPMVATELAYKATLLQNIKAIGLDLEPLNDTAGRPPGY
jgi:P27 family predicted phage terminase small subunit